MDFTALLDSTINGVGVVSLCDGERLTRQRFISDVEALANRLEALPYHYLGLFCEDSYLFAVAFCAVLSQKKTPVLLPSPKPDFITAIGKNIDALLSDQSLLLDGLPVISHSLNAEPVVSTASLPSIDKQQTVLLYTSGSTGEPKRVEKRLQQLCDEVAVLEQLWGKQLGADVTIFSTVSHQHVYGLLFRLLWPLLSGRCFDSETFQYPEPLLANIQSVDSAALMSSPSQLKRMPELVDLSVIRTPLRALFCSGGPLLEETSLYLLDILAQPVIEVYGSTETGGIARRQRRAPGEDSWQALPEVELLCNDEGCLQIRSPFEDSGGWYAMADAVSMQGADCFCLRGRVDKIVKVEDKRLSMPEMEQQLRNCEWIDEAAVTVLEGRHSSVAVALALTASGQRLLQDGGKKALVQRVKSRLANYFENVLLPKKWRFLAQLPYNSQGKLTQQALRELFEEASQAAAVKSQKILLPQLENIQSLENAVNIEMIIPSELHYFRGHFEGRPVLPGVVQIDWAMHFAAEHFQIQAHVLAMEVIKFHDFVLPGDRLCLSLKYRDNKVSYKFVRDGKTCSSGRLVQGGR